MSDLQIISCIDNKTLPKIDNDIKHLAIDSCHQLNKLSNLQFLYSLSFDCCDNIYFISYFNNIKYLKIKRCDNIVNIPIEYKKTLKRLKIRECDKLPDTNPNVYKNLWYSSFNNNNIEIKKQNKKNINKWFNDYKNNSYYKVYRVDEDTTEIRLENINEHALDMTSNKIRLVDELCLYNCNNLHTILKTPGDVFRAIYFFNCHQIKEINAAEVHSLSIYNCKNLYMIKCLNTIDYIFDLRINNYENLKFLTLPEKLEHINLTNNNDLSEIIFNDKVSNICIDNCPKITNIPYVSTITSICLYNQDTIINIPLEYSNQLKFLRFGNCKWLSNTLYQGGQSIYSHKVDIKHWYLQYKNNFMKNIKFIQKMYKTKKYNKMYNFIFYRYLDEDVISKIVSFIA